MKTINELRIEGDARVSIHDMNRFEAAILGGRGDLDGWLECHDEEEVRLHIGKLLHLCVADLQYENQSLRAFYESTEKQEPVGIQHRVPVVDSNGECVGYSAWKDGKGLDHWPHRSLYAHPVANARLIAAAPELLGALKWMVLRAEEAGYPDGKCLEEAHAAIAKATGEQQ